MDIAEAAWFAQAHAEGRQWTDLAAKFGFPSGDVLRKRVKRALVVDDPADPLLDESPVVPAGTPWVVNFGRPIRLLMIPDTQAADGRPLDHFRWAGQYAADKAFDAVVHIGDWGDFPSISSYNSRLGQENLRLARDIAAVEESMWLFNQGGWTGPAWVTTGNHEERLSRYIGEHPELAGLVGEGLIPFEHYGWTQVPWKTALCINGVYFRHYFSRTARGWEGKNPHPDAETMCRREMLSCVAGHTPGLSIATHPTSVGMLRGLIAGSFYLHDEEWIGAAGTQHYWRGMIVLNALENGSYSLNEVDMAFLRKKYGP